MTNAGRRRYTWGALLALAIMTALVYLPSLPGGFVWDDHALIVYNTYIHDLSEAGRAITTSFWDVSSSEEAPNPAYRGIYRPSVKLLLLFEYALFGADPWGYHLANVLLHSLCVVLLFAWLRRRLGGLAAPDRWEVLLAAGLGAALFGVHPTRPESISWISGVSDVLMVTLGLGALLLLSAPRSYKAIAGGCVLLSLAVLAKEPAVLLPLLLIADGFLLPGASAGPRVPRQTRRAVAIGSLSTVAATFSLRFFFVERVAIDPGDLAVLPARVMASFGHYVTSTVYPLAPSVHPAIRQLDEDGAFVFQPIALITSLLVLVALTVLAVSARRRPELRPWLADALYFVVPLAPVVNLFTLGLYSLTSERFLYLPHIGMAAFVARALFVVFSRRPVHAKWIVLGAAVLLAGLSMVTVPRQRHFRSEHALWEAEFAQNPKNIIAVREIATLARDEGRMADALEMLVWAQRVAVAEYDRPRTVEILLEVANLRLLMLSDAEQEELRLLRVFFEDLVADRPAQIAVADWQERLVLDDAEHAQLVDDVERVQVPYALSLLRTLEVERAIPVLEAIVAEHPRSVGAWNLLVMARARAFDFDGADAAAQRANEGLPGHAVLVRAREAVAGARAAVTPLPDEAIARAVARATAQMLLGAPEAARRILAPHLEANPIHADLVLARARADVADRRFDLARAVLDNARALDPAHRAEWDHALAGLSDAEGRVQHDAARRVPR